MSLEPNEGDWLTGWADDWCGKRAWRGAMGWRPTC